MHSWTHGHYVDTSAWRIEVTKQILILSLTTQHKSNFYFNWAIKVWSDNIIPLGGSEGQYLTELARLSLVAYNELPRLVV